MPKINIIKANGEVEPFDPQKVINSLKRSGANNSEIKNVLKTLYGKLKNNMTTSEIYTIVYSALDNTEQGRGRSVAGRYSLKKAISELGPTGFPFEKFIAGIFSEMGYSTETNIILKGKCVEHEVDVIAKKDNETQIMESKFHKRAGFKTTVKTALYVYARYLDIKISEKVQPNPNMWLVTNAKVTSEVKKYSLCTGLRIVSWDYPNEYSLRNLIDKTKLHPITAIASLDNFTKDTLLQKGVVFSKDIVKHENLFTNKNYFSKIVKEAELLTNLT